MGFIKAFAGAIGGTLADQWLDFLTPPAGLAPTAAIFPAVAQGQNNGRGSNTKGSSNIITNGSRIVVPEGYGLLTFTEGRISGFISEPGGYTFTTDEQNSQSIFAGDGFISPLIKTSWERFKFGGQPGAQQIALYVNLKEIPNNRFGTQSEIYWDDAYLNAQVGALVRGTYTLKITDPILFISRFVPATYITAGGPVFDFTDIDNDAAAQLFNEIVSALSPAFSLYTNDPSKGNRISRIQSDALGFAQSLGQAVEDGYKWRTERGLEIVSVAIQAIEYDEDTRALLSDVKKADALSGQRGNTFLQQSVARGVQAAGETGGGAGLAMFGMGAGAAGGMAGAMQQQPQPTAGPFANPAPAPQQQYAPPAEQAPPAPAPAASAAEDPVAKLTQLKSMLDAGLITQADFDAAKAKVLGL
ncbi:SPFH domain-containing protein [Rarobacter faecitabidus]|uniref:Membrane protease subunit (Stomatin/prohibitin family) n=1 Tax=Rarobacter faecitabidus TaxID=13243 RepID=A0A542ZTM4_RARFA|nr:SPFH domain-containing protein [Rarobacter faecitabidus]TQL63657.1 membrane protease subunit (stomatin/prohibitin family) [Rarobacter faecitabidus]